MLKSLMAIFKTRARQGFSVGEQQDFRCLYTDPPVSYADQYPGVPEPEPRNSPTLRAVEWIWGDLHGEDMPTLAADLLESGLDTPSMRRLAGEMRVDSSADVEELVGRMFRELGVAYPLSGEEMLRVYSRQVAREVIRGRRNAWAAASHLVKGTWPRKHENTDLQALKELLDALDWNAVNRGTLPELTNNLIEILARLGARTKSEKRPLRFGLLEGEGRISDDFNAPLPNDLQALFEGRDEPSVE